MDFLVEVLLGLLDDLLVAVLVTLLEDLLVNVEVLLILLADLLVDVLVILLVDVLVALVVVVLVILLVAVLVTLLEDLLVEVLGDLLRNVLVAVFRDMLDVLIVDKSDIALPGVLEACSLPTIESPVADVVVLDVVLGVLMLPGDSVTETLGMLPDELSANVLPVVWALVGSLLDGEFVEIWIVDG